MVGTTGRIVRGRWRTRVGVGAAAAAVLLTAGACGQAEEIELERGEGGMMPPVAPPEPEGFDTVEISGVSIEIPDGWEAQEENDSLCVTPPGQSDCAYGAIQLIPEAADRHPDDWPSKGDAFFDDDGWAGDTDSCRSLNTASSGNIGVSDAELTYSGLMEHADELKSNHSVWDVSCVNDDSFEVRMWFLPISDILLYVWSVDAQYDQVYDEIAQSMDTTDHRD